MNNLTMSQRRNIDEFLEFVSKLPLTLEQKIIFVNKIIDEEKQQDEEKNNNKEYFNSSVLKELLTYDNKK